MEAIPSRNGIYVKRCVRKGLIKIKLAPANRYFYYLTRKGFAEKSRRSPSYRRPKSWRCSGRHPCSSTLRLKIFS